MAKTFGYGLQAFAGGFQTGLGLGMENKKIKMLQDEQKRAEKLAKEKEENATNWLNTNKDSLMNFHTQSQDVRNMLILESINYKKEWTDYLRDVEDFLQSGDLEGLKNLNNMEEERIKAERDMLGIGVRPEKGFIGKYYSEKDMEYVKKLQMGKLPIKPIGTKMYEEEFGELPAEPTSATDAKLNFAISSYNAGKINFDQLSKYMGTYIAPEKMSAKREEIELMKQYGATNEEIKNKLLGVGDAGVTTPAPTSTENIRTAILDADTFKDAERIYKNYADKYDETALGITDLKQDWGSGQISYLNKVKKSIENLLVDRGDKGKWLNNKPVTQEMVGIEFEGEQPASDIYEILYKSYIEYLEKLRKLGIDVTGFPKLKPLSEIEKVGGWEGAIGWGVKGVGFGIKKGDYKSIYK